MLERSIIVAAHPDDEVLWFSSILEKVDAVLVCFISNEVYPKWTAGRRHSLKEYPVKNISCLELHESGVLNGANWKNPVETEYGLKIVQESIPLQRVQKYTNNYDILKQLLGKHLEGYRNVFTHNPWGEYGHEEHVQVHRVVKALQSLMGFHLWYSNYVAEKSFAMMSGYRERVRCEAVARDTNKALARTVTEIYKKNNCWTWHNDWEGFKQETFIKETSQPESKSRGRQFPINFIKVGASSAPPSMIRRTVGKVVKDISHTLGVEVTKVRVGRHERVVSLQPKRTPQGTMLLSWYVYPFLLKSGESLSNAHTTFWDCFQVAQTFLDLGYCVDVIDSYNRVFQPAKRYDFFVGHRINFDRMSGLLNEGCVKMAYMDTAHWVFNNEASYCRKYELQQRKGMTIKDSHRLIEVNRQVELADYVVTYGNQFTLGTYRYADKPTFPVPMSTCVQFPRPEQKNYDICRTNFLWFGSHGFVHKGLDLVLEAFAAMPEYQLYVCGPVEKEKEFVKAFYQELYQTPNIHTVGWVDVNGPDFAEILNACVGLVYPSCSEGQAGTVTTSMHAGLIPLVSYESGVDVDDFGVVFKDHAIQTIQDTVRMVTRLPADRLAIMARKSWECAQGTYTRERFAAEFKKIVLTIMEKAKNIQRGHLDAM